MARLPGKLLKAAAQTRASPNLAAIILLIALSSDSPAERKMSKSQRTKKACGFSLGLAKMKTRHFAASGCKAPEIFVFSFLMPLQKLQTALFFKSNEGFDVICWRLRCSARASSNHLYWNVPVA